MKQDVEKRHGGRGRALWRLTVGMGVAAVVVLTTDLLAGGVRDETQPAAMNQPISIEPDDPVAETDSAAAQDRGSTKPTPGTVLPSRSRFLRPPKRTGERRRLANAEVASQTTSGSREDRTGFPSGLGALFIVLALMGAIAWAARRWIPAARASDSGLLRVVGRTSLSPKHNIALIQLGNRFVMLGLGTDRLTTLCEVVDETEVAGLVSRIHTTAKPKAGGFDDLLAREASDYRDAAVASSPGGRGGRTADSAPEPPPPDLGRPVTRRSSLNDLLRRLRTLQAKV